MNSLIVWVEDRPNYLVDERSRVQFPLNGLFDLTILLQLMDIYKLFEILQQDGPGFNALQALDEIALEVSSPLVRDVLLLILLSINGVNKSCYAKLACKFFASFGQRPGYKHASTAYNLTMKIFTETKELKATWRLVDEMMENGLSITTRTFNILICTCGEAGLARKVVERFIKLKTFNYQPFRQTERCLMEIIF